MKKTLTALCFALCASFAFAQTNNVVVKSGSMKSAAPTKVKIESSQAAQQGSYKGSIFSKTEGDTIPGAVFTFGTMPQTGVLTATDIVNGDTIKNAAHAQSGKGATWNRIENVPAENYEADYPVSFDAFGDVTTANLGACYSNTVDNGWMFMAMQEQIAAWGGTGTTGAFNAYFQLPTFSTLGAPTVEMVYYERYRCFNQDNCWIDYSFNNGATWSAIEINVRGVDVDVNNSLHRWGHTALPLACSDQPNLSIRIRWACNSNAGGAYGYFWVVDDISFLQGAANSVKMVTNEYFEGFYHQIPQGMQLPLVWNAEFVNNGANAQTHVSGQLYFKENRNANAEELAHSSTLANIPYLVDTNVLIDPTGWYNWNGFGYYHDENGNTVPPTTTGTLSYLPTENLGRHFFYSDLTSDQWEHMYKVKDTTVEAGFRFEPADEVMYQVNPVVDNQAVWSHDNGMLTANNYWLFGMVAENIFTSDIESEDFTGWYNSGYLALTSYTTGSIVPEGWVIKGVEYVPSSDYRACAPDAVIYPRLFNDSVVRDGDGSSVYFRNVNHGANLYTTTMDDLNDHVQFFATNNGDVEDTFHTIRIMFPAQPALRPNQSYRLGYEIIENGSKFSCATANVIGFRDAQDEFQYFYNTEGLEDYGVSIPVSNVYSLLVYDNTYGGRSGWQWLGDSYPMIRMIVGPYEELPQASITFTCENPGPMSQIYDDEDNELCGETISAPANATMSGYVASPRDDDNPEDKWFVDEILIDGVSEFKNDTTNNFENFYISGISFSVETADEGTEHNVVVKFINLPEVGINEAYYNTKMSLYPNPATSNVTLNIEGVEGMVELSLIDMSGRVIRTSKVNAEQAQVIDLNGLAKGAYFVRVTNSSMTKVEKLIVR